MERKNLIAILAVNVGVSSYWQVENFWINLYWTRNIDDNAFNVSIMVSISAIVGVLTHILIGAMSDASKSVHGRRKIYILWGGILGAISMCFFPIISIFMPNLALVLTVAVILDVFITFFGDWTTPTRIALLTEHSEIAERGKINGLISISMGAGSGIIMLLYTFNAIPDNFYFYIGAAWIAGGSISCFLLIDDKDGRNNTITFKQSISNVLSKDTYNNNKDFYHLLALLFIIMVGNNTYINFVYIYAENGLGFSENEVGSTGLISMAIIAVTTLPLVFLSDKVGRKSVSMYSLLIAAVPLSMLSFFKAPSMMLFATCFGCSAGFVTANNLVISAWLQDLCPSKMRASLLAYVMVCSVTPMVPGSLLGGFLADYFATPTQVYSPSFFIVAALIMVIAIPGLNKIQESVNLHGD
ncbi:MAG: MFS transporter [Promethearchaeota archaeon]